MTTRGPTALWAVCARLISIPASVVVFPALVLLAAQDRQPPLAVKYETVLKKEEAHRTLKWQDKLVLVECRLLECAPNP